MRPPPVDLRLLPAAGGCWVACAVGARLPLSAVLPGAGVALCAALLAAVLPGAPAPRERRGGSHRPVRAARAGERPSGPAGRGSARRRAGEPAGRPHLVLVLAVVGAALLSVGAQRAVRESELLAGLAAEGAPVRVVGTVRSEPVPLRTRTPWGAPDRVRLELALEHLSGRGRAGPAAARVLVLAGDRWRDVPYGSRVQALGTLAPTASGDTAAAVLVVRGPPTVRDRPGPHHATVRVVRQALLRVSDGLPPDRRGLVPGAAIGDTSRVPDDLADAMRVAGLTHITAVSGAHFAIVGGVVLASTAVLGIPRTARAGVVALAMAGFVLLVHPTPSVLRAAVMGAVGVTALVLGRPSRALPALAVCVVALLVVDPWLAGSVGFALSVVATAGIVLGAGPLSRGVGRLLPERAARLVAVPLAAQCACGPVVSLLAPELATYAVPANVLAAPAVPPATVLGVLAALLAPWWEPGATRCAEAAGWATAWIATVARTAAAMPGSRLPWPGAPWGPVLLAAVTTGVVVATARAGRRAPRGA